MKAGTAFNENADTLLSQSSLLTLNLTIVDDWTLVTPQDPSGDSSTANRAGAQDLSEEVAFLAARALSLGGARANANLAAYDLKVRSYCVLSLAVGAASPTQRELADFLRLDPSQIVALVDELEARGLIRRQVDPNDRRSKCIVATPAGESLYGDARRAVLSAEDVSLRALSPRERATLRSLLQRIAFEEGP